MNVYQQSLAREIALMGEPLTFNPGGERNLNLGDAIDEANELLAPYGITAKDITEGKAETPFFEAAGSSDEGHSGLFQLTDNKFVEQPSSLGLWDKIGSGMSWWKGQISTNIEKSPSILPWDTGANLLNWATGDKSGGFTGFLDTMSEKGSFGTLATGGISIMMLMFIMMMMNNNERR